MNTKTKLITTTATIGLIVAFNAQIRPILQALSAQRTPHAHWYSLTIGHHTYECTPANTGPERDALEQYGKPLPEVIPFHRKGQKYLYITNNTTDLTILSITHNTITRITHITPHNQHRIDIDGTTIAVLPHAPHATQDQHVELLKHHVDEWDY